MERTRLRDNSYSIMMIRAANLMGTMLIGSAAGTIAKMITEDFKNGKNNNV